MLLRSLTAVCFATFLTTSALADAPRVVATLKPIHSIVANIMKGVGEPALLMSAEVDPHTYTLKPSEAKLLQDAQLIFWVGPKMEEFLTGPLEAIGSASNAVALMEEGDGYEDHGQHKDEHDHAKHADHDDDHKEDDHAGHKHDDDHKHDDHKEEAHDHDKDGHDEHAEEDAHIWLDPVGMKESVSDIASSLVKADPANKTAYETNAKQLLSRIKELSLQVESGFSDTKKDGFLTGHDAFGRFEARYGLTSAGSITHHHEAKPGAARIRELQKMVSSGKVRCILTEPQSDQGLIRVLTENAEVKTASVDPSGSTFEPGPELYFSLIESIATAFRECLSE